jgi:predicted nucleic acid-binding protein
MIVIDASVVVKWFVDEEGHLDALPFSRDEVELKAPDIVLAEVAHVLRRKVRTNVISTGQALNAIASLKSSFKNLVPSAGLIDVAFKLSSAMDHSVYDAMYLACALDQPDDVLVTADKKFAAKAVAAGFGDKIRILGAAPSGASLRQENENG